MKKLITLIIIVIVVIAAGFGIPAFAIHNKIDLGKFNSCIISVTKKSASGIMAQKIAIDHQDKDDAVYTKAYTFFGIPFGTYKITHVVLGSDNSCTAKVEKN